MPKKQVELVDYSKYFVEYNEYLETLHILGGCVEGQNTPAMQILMGWWVKNMAAHAAGEPFIPLIELPIENDGLTISENAEHVLEPLNYEYVPSTSDGTEPVVAYLTIVNPNYHVGAGQTEEPSEQTNQKQDETAYPISNSSSDSEEEAPNEY